MVYNIQYSQYMWNEVEIEFVDVKNEKKKKTSTTMDKFWASTKLANNESHDTSKNLSSNRIILFMTNSMHLAMIVCAVPISARGTVKKKHDRYQNLARELFYWKRYVWIDGIVITFHIFWLKCCHCHCFVVHVWRKEVQGDFSFSIFHYGRSIAIKYFLSSISQSLFSDLSPSPFKYTVLKLTDFRCWSEFM